MSRTLVIGCHVPTPVAAEEVLDEGAESCPPAGRRDEEKFLVRPSCGLLTSGCSSSAAWTCEDDAEHVEEHTAVLATVPVATWSV